MDELRSPVTINAHKLQSTDMLSLPQPIIHCEKKPSIDSEPIPLNVALAEKLISQKQNRRAMRLEQSVRDVLASLPPNPVVCDFDVLFNPAYEVDVLKILASIGKNLPFQLIWPGKLEDGRLIYAEPDFLDYKCFELSKYNVTCVI